MPPDPGGVLAKHLLPNPPSALGVAVSGGSDSLALLHLLHDFAGVHGTQLHVVTVDHGLRSEAAEEAAFVKRICRDLKLPHEVVHWTGWDNHGNLQNEARRARYRLISEWARERGLRFVALGHTCDDQAETVLMRLARGAGVDGLAAMSPRRTAEGITWIRPLLTIRRAQLRGELQARGVAWCNDPSNDDARYDRIKTRQALAVLEPLGIDAQTLGQVAFNMARARDALAWQAFLSARSMVTIDAGAVCIDWRAYRTLPDETARRILVSAIGWVGGSEYPPRRKAVLGMIEALKQGVTATLDGCQTWRDPEKLWVFREFNPVRDLTCPLNEVWDGRWQMRGGAMDGAARIAALGSEGLTQIETWRETGRPRALLCSTPAIWKGSEVVAAPLAGFANGWHAQLENDEEAFFAALLSH